MVREATLECIFFIPIQRDKNLSDGQPHSPETWEWLDEELYTRFKGRTIAPGMYEGFYEDPDTKERMPDQSRQFIVAVAKTRLDELRVLLRQACVEFQQKSIYLSIAGQVEFIEADEHEANGSVH